MGESESGLPAQLAYREPQITKRILDQRDAARVAAFLLALLERRPARGVGRPRRIRVIPRAMLRADLLLDV